VSVGSGTVWVMAAVDATTRAGSVRLRLEVSNREAQQLLSAAGARRYAYNWALARIVANHAQWQAEATYGIEKADRTKPFTFFDLVKQWDAVKHEQTPWFGEHSTWTFRYAIRAAARAHADFLTGKTKFPRFKSRHRDRPRFTVTDGLRLEPGRVRVAKYGWFRIAAPCRAQAKLRRLLARGRARLMNVTVSRHSDGHWYATVCFEQQVRSRPEDRTAPSGPTVGVDVGVKSAAVVATADGTAVTELAASRALRDALRKVVHLQRDFARTEKGSKNRRKATGRLARAHAKVAARRAHALHTFTARLARTHGVVVVEDLAVANLLRNHHLAAAISDQGWGELRRQLAYKTQRHGGLVLAADRFYASSKTCSSCGAVKAKLSLATRIYSCDSCDLVLDRDVNAASNLAAWGERHRAVSASQAGDRHPGGPSAESLRHACGGDNEPAPVLAGVPGEAGTSQLADTGAA
jgi:putative transposase